LRGESAERGAGPGGTADGTSSRKAKSPRHRDGRLAVAFLWHQHQPFYRMGMDGDPTGAYLLPWVRLHAVRDYYSMAAMVADYPNVHLTINLVPSMVIQLEDYTENGATDLWMELCLTPTEHLTDADKNLPIPTSTTSKPGSTWRGSRRRPGANRGDCTTGKRSRFGSS
jgi:hypothetical protein